jgi:hypothetical protein
MFRFLARLRLRPGAVVEEHAPAEQPCMAARMAREDEIADIDVQVALAWRRGEKVLVDRLLDMRLAVRAPRPRVRPSVPVIPGRGR